MADTAHTVPLPITALAASPHHLLVARGPYVYSVPTASLTPSAPSLDPPTGLLRRLDTHGSAGSPRAERCFVRLVALSPSAPGTEQEHAAWVAEDKRLHLATLSRDPSAEGATAASAASTSDSQCWALTKRASCLSLPGGTRRSVLVSDKVGDCYLYPRAPTPTPGASPKGKSKAALAEPERPQTLKLHADPSLNPDASYLLGHTSVLTAHVLAVAPGSGSPARRYLITADRDEHIRVSRYPQAYVVERFLHGTEGFVSALHIPGSPHPNPHGNVDGAGRLLLSAGGDPLLRLWDWTTGALLGTVDIWPAVLPHRRVRSAMRKLRKGRRAKLDADAADGEGKKDAFLDVPEGWVLPSGRGVCVKAIASVQVGEETVCIFYSEGCAAVHSFVLPSASALGAAPGSVLPEPTVHTLPLPFPVLALCALPPVPSSSAEAAPARLLVSLDTAFSTVYTNPSGPSDRMTLLPPPRSSSASDPTAADPPSLMEIAVGFDGALHLVGEDEASVCAKIARALRAEEDAGRGRIGRDEMGRVQLYADLGLLPRWPGMEEDDELAGPPASGLSPGLGSGSPAQGEGSPGTSGHGEGDGARAKAKGEKRDAPELARLSLRELGRLKAHGVDVGEEMRRKKRAYRAEGPEKSRARLAAAAEAEAAAAAAGGEKRGEEVDMV